MTTEIVKSVSIANMANQRAAIMARVEKAFELLAEADAIAASANMELPGIDIRHSTVAPC
jgi:hypothetical protein